MASVAEVFAGALRQEGIRHVFGFPGGATVELAERARQAGIEFVLAHGECAAGYMAAMHGDLTGLPGVLLTTLGPGAANALNPTANAYLDRSPMLTVTGRLGLAAGVHAHQRLNQVSLFEPLTKWSATVEAASFPRQLHRALRIAAAERPGPVHLDLPADQAEAACPDQHLEPAGAACVAYGLPDRIEEAAGRLRRARRPLVIAGYGALRLGAGAALRRFLERWGVAVVTTPKAKGVVPESHPLWAGVIEMAGPRCMDELVASADLHLAVGFDPVEVIRHWHHRTPTIHVDRLPNTDEVYLSELDLVGDVAAALDGLAELAPEAPRWREAEVRAHRDEYRRRVLAPTAGLAPSRVLFAAREALDASTIVVSDVGSHKMLLGGLWPTEEPHTFFMSNGLGTMGFGLPAAVAAQLLRPDRRVVAFTGDGGFAMVAAELGTAVDRQLPVLVVVFDDRSLDRIVRKQEAQGYPALGTRFGNPDFVRLAEAYGAAGFRAETEAEFGVALGAALAARGPALIAVRIDPEEYRAQFES